jgi:alpha-beta hydrolase superfamily lysophospholipase
VDDAAEAMAIGRRLGERVVIMGSSTGATLGTLIASRPDLSADLAGLVALSPNYALQNWRSFLLTIPFAREVIPYLGPATFGEASESAAVNANWTVTYPTAALLPMARLVEIVRGLDFASMRVPALFVYSPGDAVVDAARTVQVAGQWGAPHQTIEVPEAPGVARHIVAGDLISPATTGQVAAAVTDWIRALPAR